MQKMLIFLQMVLFAYVGHVEASVSDWDCGILLLVCLSKEKLSEWQEVIS